MQVNYIRRGFFSFLFKKKKKKGLNPFSVLHDGLFFAVAGMWANMDNWLEMQYAFQCCSEVLKILKN